MLRSRYDEPGLPAFQVHNYQVVFVAFNFYAILEEKQGAWVQGYI